MSKYEVAVIIELELDDTGVNVSDETQQDAQFERAFEQADVLVSPTAPITTCLPIT